MHARVLFSLTWGTVIGAVLCAMWLAAHESDMGQRTESFGRTRTVHNTHTTETLEQTLAAQPPGAGVLVSRRTGTHTQ